jgi:hypothetical protein
MSTRELYLEPMTAGMILDRAFRIYAQNFTLMISLTAIVHVPILLLNVGAPLVSLSSELLGLLATLIGSVGVFLGLLIITPLVTGAATKAVSEKYLGNEVTALSALKFAWHYVGTLLLIQIVVGLIVFGGFLLFLIPGILWMLSYSLVVPVAVLENSSDRTEIRHRSWELVRGNRGKVFIVMLVVILTQILLGGSGSIFIQLFYGQESEMGVVLAGIFSSVAGLLTYPLQAIAVTLLYYDLRIRKEGFDLEMLSRAIVNPDTPA